MKTLIKTLTLVLMIGLFSIHSLNAQDPQQDSIKYEYKMLVIKDWGKEYRLEEDNINGIEIIKTEDDNREFKSRTQALMIYTNKGWEILDIEIIYNGSVSIYYYQLKRKINE
jgi:hypothetical protein